MISTGMFLVYSLYEVVSVPIYLRIVWVLCTNTEFNTPFFRMLAWIGICELVHYSVDVIFYRLTMFGPTAGWYDTTVQSRWLSLVGPWAIFFFNHPVYFLQVAIAFNRLTCVWWPMRHEKFWQILWRPLVLIAFLCSLGFTAHKLPFNATSKFVPLVDTDPECGYVLIAVKYDYYFIDQSIFTIVYNSTVLFLSILINAATLWKILALRRSGSLHSSTGRAELNLFVIAVWIMLTQVVVIGFQICNFLARNGLLLTGMEVKYALYWVYLQQPWVDDIGTMSHPWVLVFMCAPLRQAVFPARLQRLVGKCRRKNGSNIVTNNGIAAARTVMVNVQRHTTMPLAAVD